MLELLKSLSDYGISGIVASIAITFAWYQTKRIEHLTDRIMREQLNFAKSLTDIFTLNKAENEPTSKEEPRRESQRGLPTVGEPTRASSEGAPDESKETPS